MAREFDGSRRPPSSASTRTGPGVLPVERGHPIAAPTFPSLHPGLSNRKCGSDGARMAGGWRLPQSAGSRVVIFSGSASQTRVRKVGQSAVSSFKLTRRSVLVERADRRGFSHIMHMRLAKAAFVCRGYRTPMRSVIAANSNNASLLNRR